MSENKVRNFGEMGICLQKIANRLMLNEDLVKLLYYQDKDPLSKTSLTDLQKQNEVFNKNILVVPKLPPLEDASSRIVVLAMSGDKNLENDDFLDAYIDIEIFVPITQWFIKDTNLRPFAIMGEIEKSLNRKVINGLGRMVSLGFDYSFTTDEVTCFLLHFKIINYD